MPTLEGLADRLDRRPRAIDLARPAADAVAAPAAFLLANAALGARWGAVVALLVAVAVGVVRRHRQDPLAVIAVSTGLVAVYATSALLIGEGRAFFLPEVVLNAAGLLLCLGSLVVGRPMTAPIHKRFRRGLAWSDPAAMRRFHWRLTLGWVVLFVTHVVPLVLLYIADSVVGLAAVGTFYDKPTIVAMAIVSVVLSRRASARMPRPG